ncbi:MAG: OmpA family protein [Azoarcus sp.]|jgi:outer membrane protein OmpA-like peptidoglycan-associated protein|nr:OmpA family protein [Azoarcus sp.]
MSQIKIAAFLMLALLSMSGPAQTSAPVSGGELLDVASFFNGGFAYMPGKLGGRTYSILQMQTEAISNGRVSNAFFRDDLSKGGSTDATLFYAFAAPATIETFRVAGINCRRDEAPRRIEFAVSQSPASGFQTVMAFEVPESDMASVCRPNYDFSIPAKQKISARYVRITLSGSKYGSYRLTHFNAHGRFDQPAQLREDFGGIYSMIGGKNTKSLADRAMVSQQKETAYSPYLILHQKGSHISGCYVYAEHNGGGGGGLGGGKGLLLTEINEVLGTINGGVENNVFRFSRVHASDGSQSQGAMALMPVAEGIAKGSTTKMAGNLIIMNDAKPGGKEGDGAFRVLLTRLPTAAISCAVAGQKEKTADEVMAESLAKTGKVQLYGVNFDFDSDVLRSESGPVLDEVVKLARANPAWKLEIGGHTDSLGTADYNLKLSDRRAAAVVRYLTGKGIDAARLQARGYGATRPLVPETAGNDAARAQNRRVELSKQ